jgi:hypothetical protein
LRLLETTARLAGCFLPQVTIVIFSCLSRTIAILVSVTAAAMVLLEQSVRALSVKLEVSN